MRTYRISSLLFAAIFALALVSIPIFAHAVMDDADKMCLPTWSYKKPCKAPPTKADPKWGGKGCECFDMTNNGKVMGVCLEALQCRGRSFSGAGQSGNAGFDQVMKSLGELFGKLMQQQQQPQSPPPMPPYTPADSKGCTGTRFPTHDITQISNPCADYTPEPIVVSPTPTDPDACPPLSQALGLCTDKPNNCPDVQPANCGTGKHPVSGGKDEKGCVRPDTCEPDTAQRAASTSSAVTTSSARLIYSTSTGTFVVPPGGTRGDINALPAGATVVGGARDTQSNVEVAGFYGTQTFGGESKGLVAAWCRSRPWATNFLSKIITPTFFDNICKSRGYQVGVPPAPAVTLQQTKKPKTTVATTTAATTTPTVPPKVDIWAVPASVPLGGRTSIFWNTQGVTNCTETSPNGGFNQNSLSGGAATQPITAATTFSISCLAPDGSHVTGSVTVTLKI